MRSQYITAERRRWSVARYNSNNAWLYNGNNGKLNNNNLYNGLTVRPLDYSTDERSPYDFHTLLTEMYAAYKVARKSKRGKSSQMEFEVSLAENLHNLAVAVWNKEYIPGESICFMLEKPKPREVIAAWFGDRVIQTWFCWKLDQYLEKDWFDPQSYACRKGKGGLRAVLDFRDMLREATCGWVRDDVWVVVRDIQACFPSIDTALLEKEMVDFIWSEVCEDEWLRDTLCWLTRILYQSLPQDHCRIKTHPLAWLHFPKEKSSLGKTRGLAIGNCSNQKAVLFRTTFILNKLRERSYNRFALYTDDCPIIITNKKQWRIDEKEIEREIEDELHWRWHPKKKYIQHWSKGVPFLGYKIRGERILPSDRVAHNWLWKIACDVRKAAGSRWYVFARRDHLMQTVNSYIGHLKWCDANRLREKGVQMLIDSPFAKVYDFNDGCKVTIKKQWTQRAYFKRKLRREKRALRKLRKTMLHIVA